MERSSFILPLLSLITLTVITACEETVDPILDSDRQMTLWGTLDMNVDTQFIRVVPIRDVLDVRSANSPAFDVISIDLNNGEQVQWKDSMITFLADRPALLFYADLRVAPNHTYRIEIRSEELELVTSAQTTIPDIPTPEIFPEETVSYITPTGFRVTALQDITWHEVHQMPYQIEHWYRFLNFNGLNFIDIKLPFTPSGMKYNPQADELEMTLNLVQHRDSLQKKIAIGAVLLVGMGQTITVLDEEFVPPGGQFDAELLAQPGTMSNVVNGFGFLGSVGRFSVEWMITDTTAALLNYRPLSGFRSGKSALLDRRTVRLGDHPWENRADVEISSPNHLDSTNPGRHKAIGQVP